MPTTMNDIREWLSNYDNSEVSHVLIVSDTFDYTEYPVPVKVGEDVKSIILDYNSKNMQRVMEVYNLGMDIEEQILSGRSWNDQQYSKPVEEKEMIIIPNEKQRERSSWALTWMSIALQYANHRSIDPATRHGCIFVNDDNQPISMGYNSFPRDCQDENLPLTRPEKYDVIVHAETNSVINAERSLKGSTAYITGFPCPRCFSNMLNAKVKRIIYGPVGSHQLKENDIELVKLMNISKKTMDNKIEIIKYSDIEELNDLCQSYIETKEYVESKINNTNLING